MQKELRIREEKKTPCMTTSPELPDGHESEDVLFSACVLSLSIFHDAREIIQNTVGGELKTYSKMIEKATSGALARLSQKAIEKGYSGVYGIRVSTPNIVEGGAEVLVIGTGYK
jgi:uncharacterized protein YbjQ (UPF0145 family)